MQHATQEPKYQRRSPVDTPCYQIIQNNLEQFVENRRAEARPLPEYVVKEFEAFMKCGILAHGFLRLFCSDCKREHIVAFSCKKRGFCPSCCSKRMVEAASHLVDNVLPLVPYRQFVVTIPIPLRFWLQTNRKLQSKIRKIMIKELHRYYTDKAKALGIEEPKAGSICFTQRFGSDLRLNIHWHVLCPDGVFEEAGDTPRFTKIENIRNDDVETLLVSISQKIMKELQRQGYLDSEGEIMVNPKLDQLYEDHDSLTQATLASLQGRVAFGEHAGEKITKLGSGFGFGEEIPLAKGNLCYQINGFSLHAATHINTHSRDKLEKLIRYIARGPLSNERLAISADKKNVIVKLKTPWSDGTSHLRMSHEEFLGKLTALIPPPKSHLVTWTGVFSPNNRLRKKITLKPEKKKGFQFDDDNDDKPMANSAWAKNLARIFKLDVSKCIDCGGDMKPICAVNSRDSIQRYLRHIGLDPDPPPRKPAAYYQDRLDFDQSQEDYDERVVEYD